MTASLRRPRDQNRRHTQAGLLLVAILLVVAPWAAAQAAERDMLTLRKNPFSRPEVLKPKPPPPPEPLLPPEEVELELTATMVSKTAPMAVVDGELLGIGDRIEGMKLIAVMEGKAVFTRNGRKYSFEINAGRPK